MENRITINPLSILNIREYLEAHNLNFTRVSGTICTNPKSKYYQPEIDKKYKNA